MSGNLRCFLSVFVIGLCAPWGGQAEIAAVVNTDRANARGRASIFSEVVAQLRQGERVEVLEVIKHKNPRPGETAEWIKIRMPPNTLVWVNADFIDAAAKVVTASRLNARAGPGLNFSVVGSLARNERVKQVRRMENWLEIEAPSNSWAYISGLFLTRGSAAEKERPQSTHAVEAMPGQVAERDQPQPAP